MFADPVKNLKFLGLQDNMIVADLGCGTGYYTIALSHLVKKGKVYAVDVQKDFLSGISRTLHDAKISNVECIWGDIEKMGGTKLADSVIDGAVVSNVFCQAKDRAELLKEIKRILKPTGKVLLIEIGEDSLVVAKAHNVWVSKAMIRSLFESEGFVEEREVDAGEHHYGMIWRKQ